MTLAERAAPRTSRIRSRHRTRADTPVLLRHVRNGIEESLHRGDIVEADANGRLIRSLGDPDRVVTLRSTVKPFGVVALIEAGGIEASVRGFLAQQRTPIEVIVASDRSADDTAAIVRRAMTPSTETLIE